MNTISSLGLALTIAAAGAQAWAANDKNHDAHHPTDAASARTTKAMPGKPNPAMARMDTQMKAMGAMHDKMMAAKTPDERNALMAEHMKTMQDGMTMMQGMSSGGTDGMQGGMGMKKGGASTMTMSHEMMEKRMDMMQNMMQMMMDRQAAPMK